MCVCVCLELKKIQIFLNIKLFLKKLKKLHKTYLSNFTE